MSDDARLVESNARRFAELVRAAAAAAKGGHPAEAAVRAQIAAEFAWLNHTGWFAHRELEDLLLDLGNSIPALRTPDHLAGGTTVHVMTQAYQTGGPTQAVACWLEQDRTRQHVVCLTRQGAAVIPPKLAGSAAGPRVRLKRIDSRPGSLLLRAARLRAIAARAEMVLLHTHPYDVVPLLAFARPFPVGHGPKIAYVNHADHTFWLGASVCHLVDNMRESGRRLAIGRRGIPPLRNVTVPRPLAPTARRLSKEAARCEFGVEPTQVLLVTAAETTKYTSTEYPDFLSLVEPVVAADPRVVLVAAGPSPDEDAWREASTRTGGRIRAVGRLPTAAVLQQAADIYLDSFPFASLTSLLEAGAYGVPVVTYRGHPDECAVLGSDTPGVDEHMLTASTPEAFGTLLAEFVTDRRMRERAGADTAASILDSHTGHGWRAAVEVLYDHDVAGLEPPSPAWACDPIDLLTVGIMTRTVHSRGANGALLSQLPLLPPASRVGAWSRLRRAGEAPAMRTLVPEWTWPGLARIRRGLRGLAQTR